jgi:hypothetical protein
MLQIEILPTVIKFLIEVHCDVSTLSDIVIHACKEAKLEVHQHIIYTTTHVCISGKIFKTHVIASVSHTDHIEADLLPSCVLISHMG